MKTQAKIGLSFSKKGQARPSYAVPIILAAMMGFLLMYLIMVYPEERANLLGQNTTKTNETVFGPGVEVLYSSGELTRVGTSRGKAELTFNMNSTEVSYPAMPQVVDSLNGTALKTTILSSDKINLNANNINTDNTEEVYVLLNISQIKGNPSVVISYNNTKIYERSAVLDQTIVPIPAGMINVNNPIYVQLKHTGVFWESQSIVADISAVQSYYSPANPVDTQTIWIGELKGDMLRLTLNVTSMVGDGDLIAKVNDKIVYSGVPELNKATLIESLFADSSMHVGNNVFIFEAEKGSSYTIKTAKLELVPAPGPAATHTYSFDIAKEKLESNMTIKLAVKVKTIVQSGYLYFKIQPYQDSYYFTTEELASGAWSFATLDKNKLTEFGNKIFMNSPDGMFDISEFKIILTPN